MSGKMPLKIWVVDVGKNSVILRWGSDVNFRSPNSSRNRFLKTRSSRKIFRASFEYVSDENPPPKVPENPNIWYTLQRHSSLGWETIYWGFKVKINVDNLTPGSVNKFRVQDSEECIWSDILTVPTADDTMSVAAFHRALNSQQLPVARHYLNTKLNAVEMPNKLGHSPITVAASKGDVSLVSMLLNFGADVESREPGSYRTPLMIAAYYGHLEMVNLLVDRGANWSTRDRFGQNAVHYAALNDQSLILKIAPIQELDGRDNFGRTPLTLAAAVGASEYFLKTLIEKSCNVNAVTKIGQTALMEATLNGNSSLVKLLLSKGADSNLKNIYGHAAKDLKPLF